MSPRPARPRTLLTMLALLGIGAGLVIWIDPFGAPGLVVHVRVTDAATGQPISTPKVRGRFDTAWIGVDDQGRARLEDVQLPPGVTPSPVTLSRLIEVNDRYAVAAPTAPTARRRDDGSWEVDVPVETFGLLTISLTATILPNVRAFVESAEGVRAVPVDGRGVARLGQSASYRVFPGPKRIPVVVLGDSGVAMARWMVRTPGPGAQLTRTYTAIPATPVAGRVVLGEGEAPPSLSGRLRFEPHAWRTLADGDALEVLGPLDSVVVQPDGTFLAPHTSPGDFDLVLDLDFLGTTTWSEPTRIHSVPEDLFLDVDVHTAWLRLTLPEEAHGSAHPAEYEISRTPRSARAAALVHYAGESYVVLPETGIWDIRVFLPGSDAAPPRISETHQEVNSLGGHRMHNSFTEAPNGTLVIDVPDAIRTSMRGATLTLDTGRTTSLLANLTRTLPLKHVRAGRRQVRVAWRDRAFAPFVAEVEVTPGKSTTVRLTREAAPR